MQVLTALRLRLEVVGAASCPVLGGVGGKEGKEEDLEPSQLLQQKRTHSALVFLK